MTVDKTALKKLIDASRPKDSLVLLISPLDKDSVKKFKIQLDRFLSNGSDFVVSITKRG
jgi:hypothetical protein